MPIVAEASRSFGYLKNGFHYIAEAVSATRFLLHQNKIPLRERQNLEEFWSPQNRFLLRGFCYKKTGFRYTNAKCSRNPKQFWLPQKRFPLHRRSGSCYQVSVTQKQVSVTRTPIVAETSRGFGYLKNGLRYIAETVSATRFQLHENRFPLHERQMQQKPEGVLVASKTVSATSQKRFLLPGFCYIKIGFRYVNVET